MEGHLYRGRPWSVNIDAALGQWGDLQIELLQLNDDRPSLFREILSPDQPAPRLHHVCLHPDSVEDAIRDFEREGHPVVFDLTLPQGTRAVLLDTVDRLGHFVELYERTAEIAQIYDFIRRAAQDVDRKDLIRSFEEIFADE